MEWYWWYNIIILVSLVSTSWVVNDGSFLLPDNMPVYTNLVHCFFQMKCVVYFDDNTRKVECEGNMIDLTEKIQQSSGYG